MPYIKKEKRKELNDKIFLLKDVLDKGNENNVANSGDLNYVITELLVSSLKIDSEPKYDKINTAIGVLEAVKLELYRRLAIPYEDVKIKEQGDIPVYIRFTNWLSKLLGQN